MRIAAGTTPAETQVADMEWGFLAALLMMTGSSEPSREPRLIVFGPCCGPAARQAEPGGDREAGG
jgi:hypothetical protein